MHILKAAKTESKLEIDIKVNVDNGYCTRRNESIWFENNIIIITINNYNNHIDDNYIRFNNGINSINNSDNHNSNNTYDNNNDCKYDKNGTIGSKFRNDIDPL